MFALCSVSVRYELQARTSGVLWCKGRENVWECQIVVT
nr:MAG TPA: hypothetical protein [Caudoviricetes sp.]